MMADPSFTHLQRRNPGVRVLADLRTAEGVKEAFGANTYPGVGAVREGRMDPRESRHRPRGWRARSSRTLAVDADAHAAARSPRRRRKTFRGEDDALYVEALKNSMPMFSPDGVMAADGAEAVHTLLAQIDGEGAKRDDRPVKDLYQ